MQKKLKHKKFLDRLTKTKSVHHMQKLITNYVADNSNYIHTTRSNNGLGDCNGDGGVNVLDVVILVNFVLLNPSPYTEQILSNCNVRWDDINKELYESPADTPNVLDIVSLVSYILWETATDIDEGDENTPTLNLVIDDTELNQRVNGYQWGQYGYDYETAFNTTNSGIMSDYTYPYEFGSTPLDDGLINRVLITAPHAQRVFRPTKWNTDDITGLDNNPSEGLYYCSSFSDTSCHKGGDTCTGAMAKVLSEITGAWYIASRNKQEDANYYDSVGFDFDGYEASSNIGSFNVADPDEGYYTNEGLQTPTFNIGHIHPFKSKISQILETHPEIKLVIDLHGSSSTTNHWDVDFGLLGYNGSDGTMNMNEADIGDGVIPYELLSTMVDTLHEYEIGLCNHDCANSNTDLSDCEKYSSNCPDGITGHGPISFNDFAGANQNTVTKFVNQNFPGVNSVQIETASIYRCLGTSGEEDVIRYMRALQKIVHLTNIYYNNIESGL